MALRCVASGELQERCQQLEIARDLKVTQKSAWFMLGRIRLALKNHSWDNSKIGSNNGGEVEVDETYIGGRARTCTSAVARPFRRPTPSRWATPAAIRARQPCRGCWIENRAKSGRLS